MYYRYSTAFSYLFLIVVGIYCLKNVYALQNVRPFKLSALPYGILVANSMLGVWKWGNPAHGMTVERLYGCTRLLQRLFLFPCIVGQLWYDLKPEIAYVHPLLSLGLLLLYGTCKQKHVDLVLSLNVLSCCCVSSFTSNWFGLAAAMSYSMNHFALREEGEVMDMPAVDFHNYALCFFSYFSVRALQGLV